MNLTKYDAYLVKLDLDSAKFFIGIPKSYMDLTNSDIGFHLIFNPYCYRFEQIRNRFSHMFFVSTKFHVTMSINYVIDSFKCSYFQPNVATAEHDAKSQCGSLICEKLNAKF
jgi:hypothetical protein